MIKIVLRLASYLPQRLLKKTPRTLVSKVRIAAANLRTQIQLFQVFSRPGFEEFFFRFPSSAYKHIEQNDLARSLTWAQRASSHLHHYTFLQAHFSPAGLRQVLNHEVRLFEAREQGHSFAINLVPALPGFYEGELSLNFVADGIDLFVLSFTFVSGSVVGCPAEDVILISRIQGTLGEQPVINAASRALQSVSPQALLVSALEGIAQAVSIAAVTSVSAINQPNYMPDIRPPLQHRYDDFFDAWGATLLNPGFYCLPVPFPHKPLQELKPTRRQRSRRRRALKSLVAEQARLAILPGLVANALPSKGAKSAPQSSVSPES